MAKNRSDWNHFFQGKRKNIPSSSSTNSEYSNTSNHKKMSDNDNMIGAFWCIIDLIRIIHTISMGARAQVVKLLNPDIFVSRENLSKDLQEYAKNQTPKLSSIFSVYVSWLRRIEDDKSRKKMESFLDLVLLKASTKKFRELFIEYIDIGCSERVKISLETIKKYVDTKLESNGNGFSNGNQIERRQEATG